jgi:hypothetical protein
MYSADLIRKNTNRLLKFCLKEENCKLRAENMDEYKQLAMRSYPNFHSNYPTLFFMIVENPQNFDKERFNNMLDSKLKIEKNETTLEEESKKIGEKYYDEFVKPSL